MAISTRPVWLAILVVVAAIHLATIKVSPVIWQDEVQIVDLGRSTLSPGSDWSLNWSPEGRPVEFLNYLGPVLQEATYRWLAPSIIGPRLSTLGGGLVAASLLFWWLRSRAVPETPATALAALFLIDPIFVQGYRGARVDAWVIALMLAACLLVGWTRGSQVSAAAASRRTFAAGLLVVIAFFMWPSAIYLVPLVALELFQAYRSLALATVVRRITAVTAGAVFGFAACAVLTGGRFPVMFADGFLSQQAYYRTPLTLPILLGKIRDLGSSFQQSPIVPLLATATLLTGRNHLLGVAALITLVAMLPSNIYVHRVVYLLPYLIGLLGSGWLKASAVPGRRWPAVALGVAVASAAAVSLVARPALAIAARVERDPALIEEAAATMPAMGSSRLFLGAWEFYYAGRLLGWKMVRPYGVFASDQFERMFTQVDYALISEGDASTQRAFFAAMGWHLVHQVSLPPAQGAIGTRAAATERRYFLYSRWPGTGDRRR